jgi:hypothetical protein
VERLGFWNYRNVEQMGSKAGRGRLTMTAAAFVEWLAAMKDANLARSDAAAARLLGVSANTVVEMKQRGADQRTALACRALFHRLEPWK